MNYIDKQILFQEVPDEVSLSFLISGCKMGCYGCHSVGSWDQNLGTLITKELLLKNFKKYKYLISCVLFFGGEWHPRELREKSIFIRQNGLKVCLYTGLDLTELRDIFPDFHLYFNYIKVGKWIKDLGGLDSKITNQRFYEIRFDDGDVNLIDLTKRFQDL